MALEIEFGSQSSSACGCCGRTSQTLRGFVAKDGDAHAVYFAGYTEGHEPVEGTVIVSIGDWSEGSTPDDRKAVLLRVRWIDGAPQVMVGGPDDNPWGEVGVLGQILTREEALGRADIQEYFHVSDHVLLEDERFSSYLAQAS